MANSTPPSGSPAEPALIYDGGERRTHNQHATEAYDLAGRADGMDRFAQDAISAGNADATYWAEVAESTRDRAQWHATMAVYEALRAGIAR